MRVGISLTSSHDTAHEVRAGARWMIERAAAGRESGLDSLFVGDHHAMPQPYYQNVPILGRLLAEWGDKPAGCLFLRPLWNPVLLAEQVGTLASIHTGRFILQCALGAGRQQFEAMGANPATRPSAFEEALDIARRLWRAETVTSEGRFRVRNAKIAPVPPEPVDVWIGGSVEASIDRAARLGEGWLGGPELTPERAKSWAAFYQERRLAHDGAPGVCAIRRDIFVGDSDAHAERVAGPILAKGYRGIDPSATITGSPETFAGAFRDLAAAGYTDVIVRHLTDDQPEVLGSLRRLAEVRAMVADS
jgi:alkanesulfonate monooxygenase SsuD/methylene tetrahydromethanopterin reductase-like flavin-dependent oxidoreductase (luciferase family)